MPPIIDGRRWLEQRLQHLQAQLDAGPPDDQREAIESELAAVRDELARHKRHFWRSFLLGGRTGGP